MGDVNQLDFISAHKSGFSGPFLEVGSRDYGSTQDLGRLFPDQTYIRADLSAGKSVDRVVDLTLPFEQVDAAFEGLRFGTIFCLSVMEHCAEPFKMANNLTRLLAPNGKIAISAPFAWKFHGYPSDYWRFTHEGIKRLFPDLDFGSGFNNATISGSSEVSPLDKEVGLIYLSGRWHRKNGHFLRGLSVDLLKFVARLGILRWLLRYRYVLAPTMINMIGTLK